MGNIIMTNAARYRAEILHTLAVIAVAACLGAGFVPSVLAGTVASVSQRARTFLPNTLAVARGTSVQIRNDDGELIHHVYIAGSGFSFDSGEQSPGSLTDIRFTTAGVFSVRCRVHPKMLLTVTVTEAAGSVK